MGPHSTGLTGRKILAIAAADRAGRDFLAHYNELVDNATVANLLTARTTHLFTGRYCSEIDLLDYDCDMPAPQLRKLAKARFDARMARKDARTRRYMRRHGQIVQSRPMEGLTGNRGTLVIMDDPHAPQ